VVECLPRIVPKHGGGGDRRAGAGIVWGTLQWTCTAPCCKIDRLCLRNYVRFLYS